jgi:nicotinate-nucleotide adenylyltransferase
VRIGVFGGTFDPPHIGHSILAAEACVQLKLDKVLWVLTQYPPHKVERRLTPVEDRLAMVEAALEDDPMFEVSRIDIDRPPPHFAVDTVSLLKQSNPQAAWIYLMGGDSLHDLPEWFQPHRFLSLCDGIGVMRRSGDQINLPLLERELAGVKTKIQWIDTPVLDISASFLRSRIHTGGMYYYYLLPQVCGIIQEKKLYTA